MVKYPKYFSRKINFENIEQELDDKVISAARFLEILFLWRNWKATGASDQVSACLMNNPLATLIVIKKMNSGFPLLSNHAFSTSYTLCSPSDKLTIN